MVIAIHTISLFELETDHDFFYEIFSRLIRSHANDQFIFISNDGFAERFPGKNVSSINPGITPKNHLYARIWHANKLKKVLKESKPAVLIHTHLFAANTEVPQIIFRPDVRFLYQHEAFKRLQHFSNKKVEKFFSKVQNVIVRSEKEKVLLSEKYPLSEKKIDVILPGVNSHKINLPFEKRESVKEKMAEGNEFFIYSGLISPQKNLVNLLKAFSAFKKRQKSGMQLIITGKQGIDFVAFSTLLKTYKLKEQVKLLPDLPPEQRNEIFAASYALIIPSGFDVSYENIFFALQNSIPVLASENSLANEVCAEAGIYFDSTNIKDIAEKMMSIFKEEDQRKELIEKGSKQIHAFNWEKSAEQIASIIFK